MTETSPDKAETPEAAVAVAIETPPPVLRFDRGIGTAQVWMCGFLIVVAGVIAYSNVLGIPFHVEDQRVIRDNAPLHSLVTFPQSLDASTWQQPLTMLTFAINWLVTPNNPAAFHAVNLLLHLANGVLLFLLCRGLMAPSVNPIIPMIAGILLVLHPAATESVDYVVGRFGLLALFFSLLSLLLFLKATKPGLSTAATDDAPSTEAHVGIVNPGALTLSLFCYVLAYAADTSALFLFVVVLFTYAVKASRTRVPRDTIATLSTLLPHAAVLALLVVVHYAAGGTLTRGQDVSRNLLLTCAPTNLTVAHLPGDGVIPCGGLLTLALEGCVLLILWRATSMLALGLLWFQAFVLGITYARPVLVERDMYLALPGILILLPCLLNLLRPAAVRVIAGLAIAALIFAAGAATYTRNLVWQDEVSLWSDAVAKAPESAVAHKNLGRTVLAVATAMGETPLAGDALRQAEDHLRKAVALDPNDTDATQALGVAVMRQGRPDEALDLFRDVLRQDPDRRDATIYLATIWNDKASGGADALARCIEYYRRADSLRPLVGESLARYGMALLGQGDLEAAEPVLRRALEAEGESSPLAAAAKNAQETLKRAKEMEQQSRVILSKSPEDATGLRMRAQSLALQGENQQAFHALASLLRGKTPDFTAWLLMGYVSARMKAADRFVQEWPAPPPKPQDVPSAWIKLAQACASVGLWDAALTYLACPTAVAEHGQTPLVALGDIAVQFGRAQRAYDYFQRATEAIPISPEPWLRLCDLATAGKDTAAATQYLAEAERRHADPAELDKRRERLGVSATAPVQTIIR